jgi:hypothetical protein
MDIRTGEQTKKVSLDGNREENCISLHSLPLLHKNNDVRCLISDSSEKITHECEKTIRFKNDTKEAAHFSCEQKGTTCKMVNQISENKELF